KVHQSVPVGNADSSIAIIVSQLRPYDDFTIAEPCPVADGKMLAFDINPGAGKLQPDMARFGHRAKVRRDGSHLYLPGNAFRTRSNNSESRRASSSLQSVGTTTVACHCRPLVLTTS